MKKFTERYDCKELSMIIYSDPHVGHVNHKEVEFGKFISYAEETSKKMNTLIIDAGDTLDCITAKDKRSNFAELCNKYNITDLDDLPMAQAKDYIKKIEPIKHLIKYKLAGNHENTYKSQSNFDINNHICEEMLPNCQNLKDSAIGRIVVTNNLSSMMLKIAIKHGKGGAGQTRTAAINSCIKTFEGMDFDIYIQGHNHKLFIYDKRYFTIDRYGNGKYKNKYYCSAGSFLEKYVIDGQCYAEPMGGELPDIGFIEIRVIRRGNRWLIKPIEHKYNI